ncbi:hypothetical protein TCAL_00861 [Tigriopus californicus]|uniref:tRNA wybutosine-synthesizing protein 3 homolog n=1 Tax=Tigriopus californicus TaxID=6832 RepID=A0A553NCC7_TIGCA|nr:hypothetical protein TCAL_00861 [Tigriopus californicus]|eukprot:TCALIF_00861-PA protein Name:"Similar to tyw3 tRNA wybutosine-synthesizing protein 3 homolog (Xenopus laevis)" AED:0.40 eAED:0.40 QI:0/0/0/0.5/1/1/4/0/546
MAECRPTLAPLGPPPQMQSHGGHESSSRKRPPAPSPHETHEIADLGMSPALFLAQKHRCLTQADLSRKGAIDAGLERLITALNQHPDLATLSSCSGRVVIFREAYTPSGPVRKQGCEWIWLSHDPIAPADSVWTRVLEASTQPAVPGTLVLKFEPFILHLQCRTLRLAKQFHTLGLEAGFKNSGMTVGKRNKIVLAIRSAHGLEVPLSDAQSQILVTPDYFHHLCAKINDKWQVNTRMHQKLTNAVEKYAIDLSRFDDISDNIRIRSTSRSMGDDRPPFTWPPNEAESRPVLHITNKKGLSCQDFLDALDEELEMLMEEEDDEREEEEAEARPNEEDSWREKLELNAREDLFERMGSNHVLESLEDEECRTFIGESFDTWADRIYKEFIRQRHRQGPNAAPGKSSPKRTDKLHDKPSAFQNNLKLKPPADANRTPKLPNNYSRFKATFLEPERSVKTIRLRSFPFSVDTSPQDVVNVLLDSQISNASSGSAEDNAQKMRLILRDEIRLWHPDKFMPKFRARCHPDDMDQISGLVNHVAQALINYGK